MDDKVKEAYLGAVNDLYRVEDAFNPFKYIFSDTGLTSWANTFIDGLVPIALLLLALVLALRIVHGYIENLHGASTGVFLIGVFIEFAVIVGILGAYVQVVPLLPKAFYEISKGIYGLADDALIKQVGQTFSMIKGEQASDAKWWSLTGLMSSISSLVSSALSSLAISLFFVMGLYQSFMFAVFFFLGPILIPFYIFKPFRNVAVTWFSSLLGYSFMGVVGATMFVLMTATNFMVKSVGAGEAGQYVVSMVYSILLILMMIQIPKISASIWSGVQTNMLQSIAMTSMVAGTTAKVAIGGAGAATKVAGGSVSGGAGMVGVVDRYMKNKDTPMSMGDRLKDSFSNRYADSPTLKKVAEVGQNVGDKGHGVMMSAMPSVIQKAEAGLEKAQKKIEARERQEKYKSKKSGGGGSAPSMTPMNRPVEINMPLVDQHAKIKDFATKYIGAEKAGKLEIPSDLHVRARPGQAPDKAIEGYAKSLMQRQCFIDKPGENKISSQSKYSDKKLGRKRKDNNGESAV